MNSYAAVRGVSRGSVGNMARRATLALALGLAALILAVLPMRAGETNSAPSKMGAETRIQKDTTSSEAPNIDIRPMHRGVTYGGALHGVAKSKHPFQMVNPMAPASYGTGEENLVKDPATKKARGVALFSISW